MYYFIYNRSSGQRYIAKKLESRLKKLELIKEFHQTNKKDTVESLTRQGIENQFTTIVVIGGDGAINHALQVLAKTEVALGVIPIGRNNIFAKTLQLQSVSQAINTLLPRKTDLIDLGIANDVYFSSYLKVGKPIQKQSFFKKIFSRSKKIIKASLILDNNLTLTGGFTEITISKISLPPNPKSIDKELTDGTLKILLADSKKGRTKLTARSIELETDIPYELYLDGEPRVKTPARIKICPKSLRIIKKTD